MEATLSTTKNKCNVFLMGDFNSDLLQYESQSYTDDFSNTVISQSFVPYIHQPTRVTDRLQQSLATYVQTLLTMKLYIEIFLA